MIDEMFQLSFIFLKVIKFSNVFFQALFENTVSRLNRCSLKKKKKVIISKHCICMSVSPSLLEKYMNIFLCASYTAKCFCVKLPGHKRLRSLPGTWSDVLWVHNGNRLYLYRPHSHDVLESCISGLFPLFSAGIESIIYSIDCW